MLRSAPHIIFWGETRNNKEIADLMLDASNTGHLVFTTLHTNDAPSAVDRLLSIGVDHRQLADSLLCVLAQRLVRKLCSFTFFPHQQPKMKSGFKSGIWPRSQILSLAREN